MTRADTPMYAGFKPTSIETLNLYFPSSGGTSIAVGLYYILTGSCSSQTKP